MKYLKIIITSSLILLLAGMTLVSLRMLNCLDWSTQDPYQLTQKQKHQDYVLISYADGNDVFFQNRNILSASAINRGFDFILNYRREHIAPEYINKHPILNEKPGAGYWLWKPYLILKTLNTLPEGTILMYADSGLLIRKPLRAYLDQGLGVAGKDVLLFSYPAADYGYASSCASADTFAAINCTTEQCLKGNHVWAGIIVLRNSPQSRAFISAWLNYCEQTDLLLGTNTKLPAYPGFVHHQHDEGLLSALSAREAQHINFVPMDKDFHKHINMHRRKSSDRSLLGMMSTKFHHFERRLLNWWPVRKLRDAA